MFIIHKKFVSNHFIFLVLSLSLRQAIYFDFCGQVSTDNILPFLKQGVVGESTVLGLTFSKRGAPGTRFEETIMELLRKIDDALREIDCFRPCFIDASTLQFYHYAGGEAANSAMCTLFLCIALLSAEEEEDEGKAETAVVSIRGKEYVQFVRERM